MYLTVRLFTISSLKLDFILSRLECNFEAKNQDAPIVYAIKILSNYDRIFIEILQRFNRS